MSYILDALQKAERERQRGHVPTLPTESAAQPATQGSLKYLYAVLALLILSVGVLIGVFQPFRNGAEPQPNAPVAAQAPMAAAPPAATTAAAPAPVHTAQVVTPTVAQPASPAIPVKPAAIPSQSAPIPVVAAALPTPPVSTPTVSETVQPLAELPANIKQEVPAMTVLFHAYSSTPSERLVQINNKPMHEGDSLQPGLKLEHITPDGMVFSYKGYRFSTGVK